VTSRGRRARPTGSRRRLGQHFLADPNLLELIVREAGLGPDDVVLEVGGGAGALTRRLAERVAHLHVIELDERMRTELEAVATEAGNVSLHWADAMRCALADLDPAPSAMVSNLPYSIATPLILRTIEELPGLREWTLMLQREIADRLRAEPGTKAYGAPTVLVQLACDVELLRGVNRAVFVPRPRVESALLRLRRRGPAAPPGLRDLVHQAFAHRRKRLARSLELARPGRLERVRAALEEAGLAPGTRAEALAPEEFTRLAEKLSSG
jgi:16S rRNA (adenine1518-N6/adenine1519-N6)-dimethyltransferase